MAKFCGKCGAKLDEATGLCPNCEADKIKKESTQSQPSEVPKQVQADKRTSERPLSGKDSKKKSKSERRAHCLRWRKNQNQNDVKYKFRCI